MIYGIASWEKLQRSVYRNSNVITVLRGSFLTSLPGMIVGGAFMASGVLIAVIFLSANNFSLSETLHAYSPIIPFILIEPLIGAWIFTRAREGVALRNTQGGIHPTDTLIVFDGSKQEVYKQQGTNEEYLAKLTETKFTIEEAKSDQSIGYHVVATFPTGKQERLNTFNQSVDAQTFLEKVKETLHIT